MISVLFIPFFVFGHFWQRSYVNTKILCNLCLHFARLDGQDGKKQKENHATKVTKIPKTIRQKYGMKDTIIWVRTEIVKLYYEFTYFSFSVS